MKKYEDLLVHFKQIKIVKYFFIKSIVIFIYQPLFISYEHTFNTKFDILFDHVTTLENKFKLSRDFRAKPLLLEIRNSKIKNYHHL